MAAERRRESGRLREVIRRLEEARSRAPKGSDASWPGPVSDSGGGDGPTTEVEAGELLWRPFAPKDLGRTRPFRTAPPSRDEFESHLSEFLGSRLRKAGPLFRVHGVSVRIGGVAACQGVELELNDGEVVAVVGPNGSGKTVLCDALTGFARAEEGRIYFGGRDVSGLAAHQRARLGMARTFARPALFESMTVLENLQVAQDSRMRGGFFACGLGLALSKHQDRVAGARGREMLEFLDIADVAHRPAAGLPAGVARLVDLARALLHEPRLVVLDEPAAGLTADERRRLSELLGMVCDELGVAVLVTDQDLPFVSTLADYIYVMESGTVVGKGAPDEVEDDPRVRAAFLRPPRSAPPPAAEPPAPAAEEG
jgi:branched-chain amino acid transport system ATP-binding protein